MEISKLQYSTQTGKQNYTTQQVESNGTQTLAQLAQKSTVELVFMVKVKS